MSSPPQDKPDSKVCRVCGRQQPPSSFNKHRAYRDGLRPACKACQRIAAKAYRDAHREQINQKRRQYRAEHGDRERQYDRARSQQGERQEYQRRYRAAHADKLRQYDQRYNIERSDVKAAHSHKRRSRKKAAEGAFSPDEWEALKARYRYTCLCCGRTEPDIRLEPDHVVPLSRGGTNWIHNIQPLYKECNARKKTKEFDYRPLFE